jgi:iron complex outermembrane receptor protein
VLDHGWRIDANTAFLRAKYDDFLQASGVNFAGNVPSTCRRTSPTSGRHGALRRTGRPMPACRSSARHMQTMRIRWRCRATQLVNAGLQWKPDVNTTVSLRVYNLFDKIYATSSYSDNQWMLGMPRTAQLAVNVKF